MEHQNNTSPLAQSRTMEDVAQYIKKMKFCKKLFGGVDEADVWRQMEALHREYEAVFIGQRTLYEEALKQRGIATPPAAEASYHGGTKIRPSADVTAGTGAKVTDITAARHPPSGKGAVR